MSVKKRSKVINDETYYNSIMNLKRFIKIDETSKIWIKNANLTIFKNSKFQFHAQTNTFSRFTTLEENYNMQYQQLLLLNFKIRFLKDAL